MNTLTPLARFNTALNLLPGHLQTAVIPAFRRVNALVGKPLSNAIRINHAGVPGFDLAAIRALGFRRIAPFNDDFAYMVTAGNELGWSKPSFQTSVAQFENDLGALNAFWQRIIGHEEVHLQQYQQWPLTDSGLKHLVFDPPANKGAFRRREQAIYEAFNFHDVLPQNEFHRSFPLPKLTHQEPSTRQNLELTMLLILIEKQALAIELTRGKQSSLYPEVMALRENAHDLFNHLHDLYQGFVSKYAALHGNARYR